MKQSWLNSAKNNKKQFIFFVVWKQTTTTIAIITTTPLPISADTEEGGMKEFMIMNIIYNQTLMTFAHSKV